MKNVFILTNEALFQDSSYFEVLGAFTSYDKALEKLNLLFDEFIKDCENKVYSEFIDIKISKNEYQDSCEYTVLSLDYYYNSYEISKVKLE